MGLCSRLHLGYAFLTGHFDSPKVENMSRGAGKPTISQRIANLAFVKTVNTMLKEGVPASQVAHFIQEDQTSMEDVTHKALTNALAKQKTRLLNDLRFDPDVHEYEGHDGEGVEEDWFETGRVVDYDDDDGPAKPSVLARGAYKRTKGGIEEVIELEALYLTQRDRIDRLVTLEHSVGAFSDKAGHELAVAADILMKRITAKEKAGLGTKTKDIRDLKGYSQETARVLSRPDSRRRVISIVERLQRMGSEGVGEPKSGEDDREREAS